MTSEMNLSGKYTTNITLRWEVLLLVRRSRITDKYRGYLQCYSVTTKTEHLFERESHSVQCSHSLVVLVLTTPALAFPSREVCDKGKSFYPQNEARFIELYEYFSLISQATSYQDG